MRSRCIVFVALLFAVFTAGAQSYPSRPVRILVGFTAGSSVDVVVRIIGQKLSEICGQSRNSRPSRTCSPSTTIFQRNRSKS